MGGKVLELPSEKLFAKGLQEGLQKGLQEGLYIAVYKLENNGYSESTACDIMQADLQGYQTYKKEKKLEVDSFFKPSPKR